MLSVLAVALAGTSPSELMESAFTGSIDMKDGLTIACSKGWSPACVDVKSRDFMVDLAEASEATCASEDSLGCVVAGFAVFHAINNEDLTTRVGRARAFFARGCRLESNQACSWEAVMAYYQQEDVENRLAELCTVGCVTACETLGGEVGRTLSCLGGRKASCKELDREVKPQQRAQGLCEAGNQVACGYLASDRKCR